MTVPNIDVNTKEAPADIFPYSKLITVPSYLAGEDGLQFDYIPPITSDDIDKGTIIRYFARRSNDANSEIIEIKESKYNSIKNIPLYVTVKMSWRIAGKLEDHLPIYTGVITSNTKSIEDANNKMPGINQKLINPRQFYQG